VGSICGFTLNPYQCIPDDFVCMKGVRQSESTFKIRNETMSFDPMKDKIAITLPDFTLKKNSDSIFGKYNEPYIVSLAVDDSGISTPKIMFNCMPFPKVKPGNSVNMLGDGHLIYGPKNPGQYVALSILVMESDSDMRDLGSKIEKIVNHKAVSLGMAAVIAANPGSAAIMGILKELTQLVAGTLKENKDDELFRTEGTFLRDHAAPYHINRKYSNLGNDYIDMSLQILPLSMPNGQGATVKEIVV